MAKARPTIFKKDNQGCIKICNFSIMQKLTKHNDATHFFGEPTKYETLELLICPMKTMEADLLTKYLSKCKLNRRRHP